MKDGIILPARYVDAHTLAWILHIQSGYMLKVGGIVWPFSTRFLIL